MKYIHMGTAKCYENYPDWREFWYGMNKFHMVTGNWYENFILSPNEMSPFKISSISDSRGGNFSLNLSNQDAWNKVN